MTHDAPRPAPPLRTPLAGVSTLLLVSLFLGAAMNAAKPAAAEFRHGGFDRIAVGQVTATFARAVRRLVGDQHRPALNPFAHPARRPADARIFPDATTTLPAVALLRSALLDLPPPALA